MALEIRTEAWNVTDDVTANLGCVRTRRLTEIGSRTITSNATQTKIRTGIEIVIETKTDVRDR